MGYSYSQIWKLRNESEVSEYIEDSLLAGKHEEFYTFSKKISQDVNVLRLDIIRCLSDKCAEIFKYITDDILEMVRYKGYHM